MAISLTPDLLISNARIHEPDSLAKGEASELHPVDIAVWNNTIVDVQEANSGISASRTIDAADAVITPGFNDAHAHSVWFGQTLLEVSLAHVTKAEDVYVAIEGAVKERSIPPDEWIIASGYNPNVIEERGLDIDKLERASGGRALCIKNNSGHALTVNLSALRAAGVSEYNPEQVEGGLFKTDENNRVTGVLDENAMRCIQDILLPESTKHIADALAAASDVYAQEGLTSVTDCGIAGGWIGHSPLELLAYQNALDAGRLKVRSQPMITFDVLHPVDHHDNDPEAFTLDTGLRTGLGNEYLQVGPTKLFTDGSILGATAAMTELYCNCGANNKGFFQGDTETMRLNALNAAASGWSLALHALGDAAVQFSIDVITEANERFGRPSIPHRIEHGGVTTDAQITQAAQQGIAIVPQPRFVYEFGDYMMSILGEPRAHLSYPGKRFIDAGGVIPGSSDRPVADGNPLKIMQAAVERTTSGRKLYGPNDRITAAQALASYTVGSARATGWAHRKGQIKTGFLADFTFLDKDPLAVATEDISSIAVTRTIMAGNDTFIGG